jgi:hypothetical protein
MRAKIDNTIVEVEVIKKKVSWRRNNECRKTM